MSRIKCNKCGADIKIKTIFLERAGCENCGNSIDFTKMDQLDGLRQGLILAVVVVLAVALLAFMLSSGIGFAQLPEVFMEMSAGAFGLLILAACVVVLVVGSLERILGCRTYEKWRKREEELEKIAQQRREAEGENETV